MTTLDKIMNIHEGQVEEPGELDCGNGTSGCSFGVIDTTTGERLIDIKAETEEELTAKMTMISAAIEDAFETHESLREDLEDASNPSLEDCLNDPCPEDPCECERPRKKKPSRIKVQEPRRKAISALMSSEMEAKGKWVYVANEMFRIYHYADTEYRIKNPQWLLISENGHRLIDGDGMCHYVPYGWSGLSFRVYDDEPKFVR